MTNDIFLNLWCSIFFAVVITILLSKNTAFNVKNEDIFRARSGPCFPSEINCPTITVGRASFLPKKSKGPILVIFLKKFSLYWHDLLHAVSLSEGLKHSDTRGFGFKSQHWQSFFLITFLALIHSIFAFLKKYGPIDLLFFWLNPLVHRPRSFEDQIRHIKAHKTFQQKEV